MKKKTGILAMVLILVVSVLALAGCGGGQGNKWTGEWKCTTVTFMEQEMTAEEAGLEMTMNIKGDGTGSFEMADQSEDLTWEETEDGITIKVTEEEEEMELKGTLEEGVLHVDLYGIDCVFEK
jgi:hypothetical protein